MPRTTIKEIARECGVSLSTVSLVLNNNPRISAKTRDKVLSAVEKHGYLPNVHARGLASRTSRALSVVVPHLHHVFSDIYFGEIVSGIYDRASEEGYKILLDIANAKFIESQEYLKLLKSKQADGMFSIASSIHDIYLRSFENSPYPFLLVNHFFPGSSLNSLSVDYEDSARQAAEHLVGLRHQRIGIIAGTNTYTGLTFRDTFIRHCRSLGLPESNLPWADGGKDWDQEGGAAAARRLFSRRPDLTAIMAANDRLAIGAMRYLRTQGIRIPQDVSVMGVDDIPDAAFTNPGLTTVRHDLYQLGRVACDRLLALCLKKIASCHEVLPVRLVPRESTGPARSS